MDQIQRTEEEKRTLLVFSLLFLFLAALDIVNLIIYYATEGFSVAQIMEQAQVSESLARTSVTVVVAIAVLSILVLIYLGVMGLIQYSGKPVGKSHITLAKVCVAFLMIGLFMAIFNIVNAPKKDWIDLFSSLANVCIGLLYIRAAKIVKSQLDPDKTMP